MQTQCDPNDPLTFFFLPRLRQEYQQDVIEAAEKGLPIPPPPEFFMNGCKYGLDGAYISGAPNCPFCAVGGGGGSVTGLVVRCKRDASHLIPVPSGTPRAFPMPMRTASS